jgi:putative chitinase
MLIPLLLKLAPRIRTNYLQAFTNGIPDLQQSGVLASQPRLLHFLAQVCHETNGLSAYEEGLSYSAERLSVIWPYRFRPKGPLDPALYARNPEKLANEVYGNRMGNSLPGDGYRYRGRGLIQLTGKDSYQEASKRLALQYEESPNLVEHPDQALSPEWCLRTALSYWVQTHCNELADKNDLKTITRNINGGYIGINERKEWLEKAAHLLA